MAYLLKEFYQIQTNEEVLKELRDLHEKKEPLIVKGVIQRANAKNQNGRVYPRNILERECSRYQKEFIDKGIALGELDHCLLGENEVLTTDGWKALKDVVGDEKVYTYNTENGKIETSNILKTHKFHYTGNMLKLTNGKKLDLTMTPNHRMLLWDRDDNPYYMKAEDVFEAWKNKNSSLSHSKILSSGEWEGESKSYFNIPNTEYNIPIKAWVGMFGLWLAEGYVAGSKNGKVFNYRVAITQKKQKNIQPIRDLLTATELPWKEYKNKDGKYEWLIHDKNIHSYFSQFGNSLNKFIPSSFFNFNKDILSVMFQWLLIGDGRNRKDYSGKEYSTISPQLAEDVSVLAFKLGYRPFIKKHVPDKDLIIEDRVIKKENCKEIFTVSANISNTHLDSRFINFELVPHDDFVYCISTQNKNFLTRSPNGYVCWTGNTDEPVIALSNTSHRITKLWWEGDDVLGEVQLLNTPKGKIAQELVLQGIPLGISSRAIGSVSKNEAKGADEVQDDLQMICFDLVGTPSTEGAFLGMTKSLREVKNFNPRKILPPEIRIKMTLQELLKK